MAIECLLTGVVTSEARDYDYRTLRRVKVTIEARDSKGERVNVVCSASNPKLIGAMELLTLGQAASVRGHAAVPLNIAKEGRRSASLEVNVTDLIIL